MKLFAMSVGLVATAFYLLCYQQKKREKIIIFNTISRVLYVVQYILLGAFEGAALDIMGTVATVAANNKGRYIVRKHIRLVFALVNLAVIASGLAVYKNIFSLFPIIGVVLQTGAFWLNDEKRIRIVSLLGCPFWFVYNLVSLAYGSAIGDALTMISIAAAIFRYDIRGAKNRSKKENEA